jgi:penicillin V acylase-like amidase (Ntn superfamily)
MTYRSKPAAYAVAVCLSLVIFAVDTLACTTFVLKTPKGTYFGRNYDFMIGDGMLVTNKRGIAKRAALDDAVDRPAEWISRHGSLTFNQFGREFPQGGMNEAGLVVELMWLDGTRYPAKDTRPALNELGWIQYMLDTCATVDDVLAQAESVRIAGSVPIHFLVADKSGAAATIEFLDGKLVSHRGDALPSPVLANDSYMSSIDYVKRYRGFGGTEPPRSGPASLDRFCRAASRVAAYSTSSGAPVDYAFGILADVAQDDYTRWSIVYDTANLEIHFRTRENRATRTVAFRAFDLSCATPTRVHDLASKDTGDVSAKFVDYTRTANRALIGRSFGGVDFLRNVPGAALDQLAAYPEALSCK